MIGPLKRLSHRPVIRVNEGEDPGLQVLDGGERAAFEQLADENAEPDFNLVQKGGYVWECNGTPLYGWDRSKK